MNYSVAPGDALIIYALDSRLVPEAATGATGQITIVSRCELRATSQTHTLNVTSGKETKAIEETKTYSVRSDFGIEYHDSWKPVPSNYPEFDPNSAYHRSHSHSACGLAQGHPTQPPAPGSSHFAAGAAIVGAAVVCLVLCRGFESPDRPSAH